MQLDKLYETARQEVLNGASVDEAMELATNRLIHSLPGFHGIIADIWAVSARACLEHALDEDIEDTVVNGLQPCAKLDYGQLLCGLR